MNEFVILGTCLFVAIASWILGYLRGSHRENSVGTLRIDTSDPDGPYLFLELHIPVNEVVKQKQVTLDVNTQSYISQN